MWWLCGVTVDGPIYNQAAVGSTTSQVAIKWLLLEWVTICQQVNNHVGQLSLPPLHGR